MVLPSVDPTSVRSRARRPRKLPEPLARLSSPAERRRERQATWTVATSAGVAALFDAAWSSAEERVTDREDRVRPAVTTMWAIWASLMAWARVSTQPELTGSRRLRSTILPSR